MAIDYYLKLLIDGNNMLDKFNNKRYQLKNSKKVNLNKD